MSYSKNTFSLFQRDVFLFISNTLTGIVIARTLGPDLRGLYAIALLIPGYAESFGRLKYDLAAVYYLGKNKATLGEMVFLLNSIAITSSILIVFLIKINFEWIYQQLYINTSYDMRIITNMTLIIIPLQFIFLNYSYLIIYLEDVPAYNRMIVGKAMISSFTSIILILIFHYGILGALIGSIISYIYPIIYAAIKISKLEKPIYRFNFKLFMAMSKYSIQYYLGGLVSHLQQYITNLMVVFYALPDSVGFYAMAKNQSLLITSMVPKAINTLLFPKISKSSTDLAATNLTSQSFRITLFILLLFGFIMAIVIKPMVYILYGEAFLAMVIPFWIILPGFVLSQSASLFNSYYSGIGRPEIILKLTYIPLIIQVILALILLPYYGMIGAAVAFMGSNIVLSLASTIVFMRISKTKISELVITREEILFVLKFAKDYIARILHKIGIFR